jgi:hypothetical protein
MKPQPKASTQEVLAGLVERITYHNAENGFCVTDMFLLLRPPGGSGGNSPWMWTLIFDCHEDRTTTHGYDPTREAAMAAFAKSWRRE